MKNLLKSIFLLIAQISFAQNFAEVNSDRFTGVIIPQEYFAEKSPLKYFTPTGKEIFELEKIIVDIQNKKETKASRHINSQLDFTKYFRQYSGVYIAEEKVIFIQFIPKEIIESGKVKWKSEEVSSINFKNCISMNYFIREQKFYELSICGN